MSANFVATVADGQRAAEWTAVYGKPRVCVRSPIAHLARLPGFDEPQLIYEVDLQTLSDEQTERLIAHLAQKFAIPVEEVRAELETHGVPILARDCTIATPYRYW